jgi:hypothetical protein
MNRKKSLGICIVALLMAYALSAQIVTNKEAESLIGAENAAFFVKPEFKLTSIDGEMSEIVGLQLGPSFNKKLYLGLGGYALVNSVEADDDNIKFSAFDFWYLGGVIEYNFFADKLFHFSLSCLIGGGDAKGKIAGGDSESSGVFVVEPSINFMVNIMPALALGISCGYRVVDGSDIGTISGSDLSGVSGSVIFLRWQEE